MPKYKYEANLNAYDTTNSLILEVDENNSPSKSVGIGGEAELTEAQHAVLNKYFVLTLVNGGEQSVAEKEVVVSTFTKPQVVNPLNTPVVEATDKA